MSHPDIELLEQYGRGENPEAFAEIFNRYRDMVYSVCLRAAGNEADAEETAQECFLKLLRNVGNVHTSLAGWLHRCATDLSIDRIRSSRARVNREQEVSARRHATADDETWQGVSQHLDKALDELPEELRVAVVEYYLGKKTQQQIADEQQVSVMTISRRLKDGLGRLREKLEKAGIAVSLAALLGLLTRRTAEAAPATLAAALDKMNLISAASSAGAGTATATPAGTVTTGGGVAAGGAVFFSKTTIACILAALIVVGGIASVLLRREEAPVAGQARPLAGANDARLLNNGTGGNRTRLIYSINAPQADGTMADSVVNIIRKRLDAVNARAEVRHIGGGRVVIECATEDADEIARLRNYSEMPGTVEWRNLQNDRRLINAALAGRVPNGYRLYLHPLFGHYLIHDYAQYSHEYIERATLSYGDDVEEVWFHLTDDGADVWNEIVEQLPGIRHALIVGTTRDAEGRIIAEGDITAIAPVRERIIDRFAIRGRPFLPGGDLIAAALAAEPLPAPLIFERLEQIGE